MKLHPKHSHWLFSLIMSMIVAGIVTSVLTVVDHGYKDFMPSWEHSFVIAWAIAFLAVLLVAPQVRKLVQRLTSYSSH
jgi:uncharacterized membrane protein YhdT